jgi:hypothetical protein
VLTRPRALTSSLSARHIDIFVNLAHAGQGRIGDLYYDRETSESTTGGKVSVRPERHPDSALNRWSNGGSMDGYLLTRTTYVHFDANVAVLLDTKANRYHGLTGVQVAALKTLLGLASDERGGSSISEADLVTFAKSLSSQNLLTRDQQRGKLPIVPVVAAPSFSLEDSPRKRSTRIHPSHILRFIATFWRISIFLRRGRLESAIRNLEIIKAAVNPDRLDYSREEASELVIIFEAIRSLFYSNKDKCLLDSLILAEFLMAHGVRPTFVIGVRTMPFAAHSWVQLDDCVLNCSLFSTQRSNVILAV